MNKITYDDIVNKPISPEEQEYVLNACHSMIINGRLVHLDGYSKEDSNIIK
jgi:hypothetical protein